MNPRRLKAYIYLIAVAAIWGAAAPIIKFTLQGIDPLPFLAYRFLISGVFSLIYFLVKGVKLPRHRDTFPLLIIYGLLAVPIALGILFFGIDNSTVLDLTLIGVLGPMIVTLGGAIFFRDHITHREKIGIGVVLAGVALNAFTPFFTGQSQARLTGNILLLIFLLSDSSGVLVAKLAAKRKIKSIVLTNVAFILGAVTIIPLTIAIYGYQGFVDSIIALPLKYHLGVWYMALASGTLAYYLYVRAQKSIEVSEATLFNYLQPIFSVPLAIIWLGESLTLSFIIGGMLIAVGVTISEYKRRKN